MNDTKENRRDSRRSVYLGEGIKVYLKDDEEIRSIHGEITDLSPWGANVFIINQKLSTYPKKGDTVRIHYTTKDKKNCYSKGRVVYIIEKTVDDIKYLRYGIEFINEYNIDNKSKENKKFYEIPDIFGPHCWCEDPFFFQEKLIFKIKNIHSQGMTLITSARNKTLIPNLEIQLKVSIPTCDEFLVNVKVVQAQYPNKSGEKDRYLVDVEFENQNSKFLQVMVEYILFCGVEVTPKELRKDNLPVDIIENSLTYYYAKEAHDMEKVIQLRKSSLFEDIPKDASAFTQVGDTLVESPDGNFKDIYDSYSRQILCKVGKRHVACIRIIFNNKDKNKSEIISYIDSMPEWLWSKKYVEISRFAWDKDYRESDVFINMIRHVVRIVIESGNTHILTSSPEALKQLYLKVGFQPINITWKSDVSESKSEESPLLLDAKGILTGEVIIEKFVWNKVYSRISKYLGLSNK
jgi:PilZ domain